MRYVCSKCGQPARDGIPLRHYNGVATCAECEPKHPEGPSRPTKVIEDLPTTFASVVSVAPETVPETSEKPWWKSIVGEPKAS